MLKRINVFPIVVDHFRTLRNFSTGEIMYFDIALMLLLPALLSGGLVYCGFNIEAQIGEIIKAIAIFGAFLFNLLALIFNLKEKIKDSKDAIKIQFSKDIHINISYSILLSLFTLIILLVYSSLLNGGIHWILDYVMQSLVYFALLHFLITLLMILNRVYIILKDKGK